MTQTYTPEIGFAPSDMQPVSGYGITLDTIKYWLQKNNINLEPIKIKQNINTNADLQNEYNESIDLAINKISNNKLAFVTGNQVDFSLIMAWDIPAGQTEVELLSQKNIKNEIQKVVNNMFDVPTDKATQEKLSKFIDNYAGMIDTCDFN